MARRRRKAKTRYITRFKRRGPRRSSSMFGGAVTGHIFGGGVYGAARGYVGGLISPLTNMIPAGQYADNVAFGIVDYLVYKNTSGMLKKVALTGLAIEAAMAGSEMTQGFGTSTGTSLWG